MTDNTIIITGVGPTYAIYPELVKRYKVAVYDQTFANRISSANGGADVICPIIGAQPRLFENARNDAALATADVIRATRAGLSLSDNGAVPQRLADPRDWLPGMAVAHLNEVYAHLRVLEAYAESFEITGVIVHEDVTPKYKALALWGKAKGVPVIHMPHNNCYLQTQPDIHDKSVADWLLVASPYMRDWYAARGFPKKRIRVVGFPTWDDWAGFELEPTSARKMLHLDPTMPIVTLCTGWAQRTNFADDLQMQEAVVHMVLGAVAENDWQLIWKLHPGDAQGQEQRAAKLAASYRANAIVVRDHLPYALRAADVVIGAGPSNVLVEAGLADTPPALFNLRGYAFDGEPPWVIEPNVESVVETVNRLMLGDEWEKKRKRFISRYAFRNDGKAKKRSMRQIKKIFNA